MCCRSRAITWRWSRAWCSSWCARCSRSSPVLAMRYAIKKWAAFAALIAAFFYLLLSGAEVATQRSFIMTAIVLVAVMVDRSALTLRNLALAALAVMLLAPEAVVHPSFQMSFAATLALIAAYERGMPWMQCRRRHVARRARRAVGRARDRRADPGVARRRASRPRPMRPIISTASRPTACSRTCWRCRSSRSG